MSTGPAFVWLTRTRQRWKLVVEVWSMLYKVAAILLSILSLALLSFFGPTILFVTAGIWFAGFLLFLAGAAAKYLCIRCPRCGHNPTRNPESGAWYSDEELYERLASLEACPACGDRGPDR